MTTRSDDGDDDPGPFEDGAERAEHEWLLAREADPGAAPPSPQIASEYAEIEKLLGELPAGARDDSWHDDVVKPQATPLAWWRRKTARWTMAGAVAATAAAAGAILLLRDPRELDVAIRSGGNVRGKGEASVGDQLVITARPAGPGDLRVYRADGALVARCPGSTECTIRTGEYSITVTLGAPVQYHVILVVGAPGAAADAGLDAFLDAARAANAHIVRHRPIDVH